MFAKSVQTVTHSQTRSANGGVDKITNGGVMDSRDIVESANSSSRSTLHENKAKASTEIAQATEENIGDVIDSDLHNCLQTLFADGSSTVGASKLIDMQRNDSTLKHLFNNLKSNAVNQTENPYSLHSNDLLVRNFVDRSNKFFNESVVQIVVPNVLRGKILTLAHSVPSSGHFGVGKTRKRILQHFFWPGVMLAIKEFCRTCHVCQLMGKAGKNSKAPLVLTLIVEQPFSRISIDIVGPLAVTSKNNKYILTVVDHATHWVEAYPLPDYRVITVLKAFSDFIARFGIPDEVLHDLGADFTSTLFQVYLNLYGISQLKCSVAHPQTNTVCEKTHRNLKAMLKAYVGQNEGE